MPKTYFRGLFFVANDRQRFAGEVANRTLLFTAQQIDLAAADIDRDRGAGVNPQLDPFAVKGQLLDVLEFRVSIISDVAEEQNRSSTLVAVIAGQVERLRRRK